MYLLEITQMYQKLNYLKGFLANDAEKTIKGLPLT